MIHKDIVSLTEWQRDNLHSNLRKYEDLFFDIQRIETAIVALKPFIDEPRNFFDFIDKLEILCVKLDQLFNQNGHSDKGYVVFEDFIKKPFHHLGLVDKRTNPFEEQATKFKTIKAINVSYSVPNYGTFFGSVPPDTLYTVKLKDLCRNLRLNITHPGISVNKIGAENFNKLDNLFVGSQKEIFELCSIYKECCKLSGLKFTNVDIDTIKIKRIYGKNISYLIRLIDAKIRNLIFYFEIKFYIKKRY